jgi:NAD(P)-dependent dehydrogenase (short-subunit alcohol dehydrogenase family)
MQNKFENKTAIIIGGSSGIGFEIARQLSSGGARVFIASRNPPSDLLVVDYLNCDVREEQQIKSTIKRVVEETGTVDILVNSMGITGTDKVEKISLSEWQEVIDTNLTGTFLTCKEVIPIMKNKQYGKIVNIASIAGRFRSKISGAHYVASKAAIIGFTRQIAFELIPHGINVNAVCPSQTMTPMLEKTITREKRKELETQIPIGRLSTVGEQTSPVLYLCSDDASYLSGAIIDVNGGQF